MNIVRVCDFALHILAAM